MPFKPGQSGNPNGRPKSAKIFRDALLVALKRADEEGVEAVQRLADKLVAQASAGDVQAFREAADRVDGKVPQAVEGKLEHSVDDSIAGLFARISEHGKRIHDPRE